MAASTIRLFALMLAAMRHLRRPMPRCAAVSGGISRSATRFTARRSASSGCRSHWPRGRAHRPGVRHARDRVGSKRSRMSAPPHAAPCGWSSTRCSKPPTSSAMHVALSDESRAREAACATSVQGRAHVNTARGAIVDEAALTRVPWPNARSGTDLADWLMAPCPRTRRCSTSTTSARRHTSVVRRPDVSVHGGGAVVRIVEGTSTASRSRRLPATSQGTSLGRAEFAYDDGGGLRNVEKVTLETKKRETRQGRVLFGQDLPECASSTERDDESVDCHGGEQREADPARSRVPDRAAERGRQR